PPAPPAVVYKSETDHTEEYLGGNVSIRPNTESKIQLMSRSGKFSDSSQLILRKIPKDAVLYLDKKKVDTGDSAILNIRVSSGDHELLAVNNNDTLYFEYFNILPFEEKMIDMNIKKENM
ncbi:MAG: hypothetical protein PVI26_13930, partial [Chitinispirillia bacterium]